jgi:cyclopropane-fatty-acyl-phospholipid synthase
MFPLSRMLGSFIRIGTLAVIDADGKRHVFGGAPGAPTVAMRLTDRSLYRKLFLNPDLYMGEAYMDGTLAFEEGSTLRDFLQLFLLNRRAPGAKHVPKLLQQASRMMKGFQQANPVGRAQQNVAHHYDIGNDFYKLFLDESMQYSCAYFPDGNETLEQAQKKKLTLIAAKLCLEPGLKVLDIGSGWGGLAFHIAALADVDVTGVTLSKEQHALSNERARQAGLAHRVRFELIDYRQLAGKFDRIVSVGMFEHVGVRHYEEFFAKVNDLLVDDGVVLLHSIGRMSPPGTTGAWFRKYIFPGGYTPSLSEVFPVVERQRLWVTDVEILRIHYAETLLEWDRRFQANRAAAAAMYDERFCRMWEFYLITAEMMFRTGSQQVFQMQLARRPDAAPLSRDYMVDLQRTYAARANAAA